jgi:hypothetical protein
MFARYGDYAMSVITPVRVSAQMKPTKWFKLEHKVLGEVADYEDDLSTGVQHPVPLLERPHYRHLQDICSAFGKNACQRFRVVDTLLSTALRISALGVKKYVSR